MTIGGPGSGGVQGPGARGPTSPTIYEAITKAWGKSAYSIPPTITKWEEVILWFLPMRVARDTMQDTMTGKVLTLYYKIWRGRVYFLRESWK